MSDFNDDDVTVWAFGEAEAVIPLIPIVRGTIKSGSADASLVGATILSDDDTGALNVVSFEPATSEDRILTKTFDFARKARFLPTEIRVGHSPALEAVTDGALRDRKVSRNDLVECILDMQRFAASVIDRWPEGEVYIDEFEFSLEISTGNAVSWVLGAKGGATIKLKVDRKKGSEEAGPATAGSGD